MSLATHPAQRRILLRCAALGPVLIPQRSVLAQKPILLIVPVPPGGGMDATARLLARLVRPALGTVLVDNKPGAALRIGLQAVRSAKADGSSMLYTSISPFTIYPFVYKTPGYDAERDLIPVAPVVSYDFALAVPGSSPVSTVADYVQAVRSDPAKAGFYAVPGAGTSIHFAGAAFARASGIELRHVPYKGSAPAMQDLIGGNVPACFNVLGEFLPYHGTDKVKVLATTGMRRSPFMPDVPTFAELGFKGMVLDEQFGVFLPANTPLPTVSNVSAAILDAVRQPEFIRQVGELGYTTLPMLPQEFAAKLQTDRTQWASIIRATGFTLED